MMSFQDFLEHAEAVFKREIRGAGSLPFSKTHVFNLGRDEAIEDGIKEVWEDLKVDMAEKVPLPFSDTTCMSDVGGFPGDGEKRGWILDRIVEMSVTPLERQQLKKATFPYQATEAQRQAVQEVRQKFVVIRIEEGAENVVSWIIYWYGVVDGSMIMVATPTAQFLEYLGGRSSPIMDAYLDKESQAVIKQAAAISHPANYVVQVTPSLTPKEERKVAQGRERPIRKKPHFIVVDHDVLVTMNPRGTGAHASPVPHERRGHWRRLADHCRHARTQGKERIWIRPTYVGEMNFTDEKNRYEVLMDFGRKDLEAVQG